MLTLFGVILLLAGIYHFVNPRFYFPIMPEWMPKALFNALGGAAEIVIGLLLLLPIRGAYYGVLGALLLMVLFLPIHVVDLLRKRPVIGPRWVAGGRLLLQFVLIVWLYGLLTKASEL